MVSEREKFLGNILKGIDFVVLLVVFPIAYFLDEFIRQIAQLNIKAYATSATFSGFLNFASNFWMLFGGFPLIWVVIFSIYGIYEGYRTRPFKKLVWLIIVSGLWATLASGNFVFLAKLQMTSRLFFVVYATTAYILILLEKWALLKILDNVHSKGLNQENLLIVGTGKRALEFIDAVHNHGNWGLKIVGLIDDDHALYGKKIAGYRVMGRIKDIPFIINQIVIDRVIFVVPRHWLPLIEEAILACEEVGINTALSLDFYNLTLAQTKQTDFNGFPLLEFKTFHAREWQLFIKRLLDIIISALSLIIFSPIMLITAIAIKLETRGPILFKQVRCGLKGRKFVLYKFRSMINNAEEMKADLAQENEMDGPVFKMKKDPRITNVGSFIRKTSIDELPQLFNVLKGDMSIVGPRPPIVSEVENYKIWQRRRLSLKPGITCIWQVSGRNKLSFDQWMKMDLEYIDNWSLMLDWRIMMKTFFVVITGYGAE
ncbi:MAG TPA: sugar transferase [bacterium]|nr:sugar transferase [bacterium]HPN44894.1 sugar transferase [bacterium]